MMYRRKSCPVCENDQIRDLLEIPRFPVHCNLLYADRQEALDAARGDIHLGYCPNCGHIYNFAFDPSRMHYTQAYENSLHFSPRFQEYASSLARHLVERYDLHHKTIVEIGSGKGDFLLMLCEIGDNRGLGFDPSYDPALVENEPEQITFIQDFYSERYADVEADLVCCRHVLEHMEDPKALLSSVRRTLEKTRDAIVFFEVPNAAYTLEQMGIWDIIYEHCSYFSIASLSHLFQQEGFRVLVVAEVFGGQFLTIEGQPESRRPVTRTGHLDELEQRVVAFSRLYQEKVARWQQQMENLASAGKRVVVWGAGSKGVSFLNTVSASAAVRFVVDLNPRKQGMCVAGTGQEIVAPEFLRDYQPEVVIIMNPNYREEISEQLRSIGLSPTLTLA